MEITKVGRREFLKSTGLVGAAGVLYSISGCGGQSSELQAEPWLYLAVKSDALEFVLPRTEMGQDLATSFVMILSQEMALPVDQFRIAYAKADARFGQQMTVGSGSIRDWWAKLRALGFQVRVLVEQRAAVKLKCTPSDLEFQNGRIRNVQSDLAVDYLELLVDGWPKQLSSTSVPQSKNVESVVGQNTASMLALDKVSGRFNFVADEQSEESANVALTVPYLHGKKAIADAKLAGYQKKYGLRAIFDLGEVAAGYGAIALVGEATWPLIQCKKAVASWLHKELGIEHKPTESEFHQEVRRREAGVKAAESGLDMVFKTPAIAHAPMETESSRAEFDGGVCRVWAPTQAPQSVRAKVARALSISEESVILQMVPAGGAFGRKRYVDFVVESALIAKGLNERQLNSSVKLIWLREDDLAREHYRPQSWQRLVWREEEPEALEYQLIESMAPNRNAKSRGFPSLGFLDWNLNSSRQGFPGAYYPAIWRSVEHGYLAFALCSFMDELSYRSSSDPIDYFLAKMPAETLSRRLKGMLSSGEQHQPQRLRSLIDQVRQMSKWDDLRESAQSGVGYGFSAYSCFGSYIALVAKVAVDAGALKVDKVWAAVDCGLTINPDGIKAQIEGGIIFGMSACLWGDSSEAAGSYQGNFGDFTVARMKDSPEIDVSIVDSDVNPTGVGELSVPVIAPAIANAVRQAIGIRLLNMPFLSDGKILTAEIK